MSIRAISSTVLALLVLAACGADDPLTPPPPPPPPAPSFAVAERDIWQGGVVEVMATNLPEGGSGVMLELGQNNLAMEQVAPGTWLAVLPTDLVGTFPAGIRAGDQSFTLGDVRVHGAVETAHYPVGLGDFVQEARDWWYQGAPKYLVPSDQGLATIDLRSGSMVTAPGLMIWGMTSMGVTRDPDVFVFREAAGKPFVTWRLGPTPTVVDTLSYPLTGSGNIRGMAVLGSDRFLAYNGEFGRTYHEGQPGVWSTPHCGTRQSGDLYLTMAPGGSRMTVVTSGGFINMPCGTAETTRAVPIFDGSTGAVAFTSDLRAVDATAFNASGTQVALVGSVTGYTDHRIRIHNAATGALVVDIERPHVGLGVSYDPVRPLLYVVSRNGLEVTIYSTTDWSVVGTMKAPCLLGCISYIRLFPDIATGSLYAVETGNRDDGVAATRFTLPPVAP